MKVLALLTPLRFGFPIIAITMGFFAEAIPQDFIWNFRGSILLVALCYVVAKYALPETTLKIDDGPWGFLIISALLIQWVWLQFIVEAGRAAKDIGLLHGSVALCMSAIEGFTRRYRAKLLSAELRTL
ncbi:MAG: hypothetical protein ACKOQM_03525 [Novosphingobium sp.]